MFGRGGGYEVLLFLHASGIKLMLTTYREGNFFVDRDQWRYCLGLNTDFS